MEDRHLDLTSGQPQEVHLQPAVPADQCACWSIVVDIAEAIIGGIPGEHIYKLVGRCSTIPNLRYAVESGKLEDGSLSLIWVSDGSNAFS